MTRSRYCSSWRCLRSRFVWRLSEGGGTRYYFGDQTRGRLTFGHLTELTVFKMRATEFTFAQGPTLEA